MLNFYKKSYNNITLVIALVIGFSLLFSTMSFANSPKLLAKDKFQQFLIDIKVAPGNIAKDKQLIRELSNDQIRTMSESFNVGHYGFLHPMRIKVEELPEVLGRDFEDFSIMAIWSGELKAIPFQFDEFDNKSHYIYIPDVNKSPIDGTYLIGDPNDELLFMYRDSGEQQYDPQSMKLEEGKILKEIVINDSQGNQRYAYLVENNSQRSNADYITTDMEESKVQSSYYHIKYNPKNFLDMEDIRPYVGTAADQRILDNIYFELSANIFSKLVKVGLNSNDNVRMKVIGVKDGPVRSTALLKLRFIFANIPLFSMQSEIQFYEQGMIFPNRAEVGKGAGFVNIFKNAEVLMYVDMNGIDGAKVSSQGFKDEEGNRLYGTVDGKMDEEELKAIDARLPGDWTWIESGLGWDIFLSFNIPLELLDGMDMSIYYEDDKTVTSKFESFPGAGPRIGMKLKGMPNNLKALEELEMEYAFWFPGTVGKGGPEGFHYQEQNPPKASFREFIAP